MRATQFSIGIQIAEYVTHTDLARAVGVVAYMRASSSAREDASRILHRRRIAPTCQQQLAKQERTKTRVRTLDVPAEAVLGDSPLEGQAMATEARNFRRVQGKLRFSSKGIGVMLSAGKSKHVTENTFITCRARATDAR